MPLAMTMWIVEPSAESHSGGIGAHSSVDPHSSVSVGAGLSKSTACGPLHTFVWFRRRYRRPQLRFHRPALAALMKTSPRLVDCTRTCDTGTSNPWCRHTAQNLFFMCPLPGTKSGSHGKECEHRSLISWPQHKEAVAIVSGGVPGGEPLNDDAAYRVAEPSVSWGVISIGPDS